MRATDITRARFDLRPAIEITRGPVSLPRSTAALFAALLLATGATAATWFIALFILTTP
jgi:hypothetical protein